MLPTNLIQEALSRAYVQAVAARAGVVCRSIESDFGFDLILRAVLQHDHQYLDDGPQLDIQLKSSTRVEVRGTEILYDLEVRAYNLLRRGNPQNPRILVLLVLPDEESLWLGQSADELILRRCAYWMSLRNATPTENVATVRITIPRANIFSVEAVWQLLRQPGEGTT